VRLHREFLETQPYVKPVVMELGSKNPVIVTSKADLKKAVEGTVRAAYGYCGQKCSAASRVYVQKEIKEQFLNDLTARIEQIKLGDPRNKDTFMGPLINRSALKTFAEAVEEVKRDGGRVIIGGEVKNDAGFANGFYAQPTVVTALPKNHRIFKEELFVPLLAVADFDTLEEALKEANDTPYGLTAGIFSEDRREIEKFMNEIQFGVVYANRTGGATTGAWPGAQTFVGWKGSGATGKGIGGPGYLLTFLREQSQTVVSG
jgi:1-pyrroline-5-carboxylate dehydrogenase